MPETNGPNIDDRDIGEHQAAEASQAPLDESFFYEAPTVEFEQDQTTISAYILGFAAPGAFLCVHHRMPLGIGLNLLLASLFLTMPLLSLFTGIFPVPIILSVCVLLIACWFYGIVYVVRHPPKLHRIFDSWAHAGIAFLSFWLPLFICFYLSVNCIWQRTWMGNDTMMPGMQKGDIVLVDKMAYHRQDPTYGDLVLIEERIEDNGVFRRRAFFGRIIALPGDEVQLYGFHPSVNGKTLQQFYARRDEDIIDRSIVMYELPHGIETSGDPILEPEKWYPVLAPNQLLFSQTNVVTLENNYYYILEDNRDSNRDRTRTSYGSIVHRSEICGRPQYILSNTLSDHRFSRYGIVLR